MEGRKITQYMGALSACMSAMAVGTNMGWTTPAGVLIKGKPGEVLTADEFSWVGGLVSIGAIAGAIPLGKLADLIGRKKVLMLLAPCMIIGYLLLAFAEYTLWMLYLGRFICGAATGAFCVVAPMYTGEIAEPSIRGVLGSFFQLLITVGILFVYALNALKLELFWINIACAIIPAIMAVLMIFFPDSPRWHLSKNHESEAEQSLRFFRGPSYDVQREKEELLAGITAQRSQNISCTEAFSAKSAKKGLFLALSLMFFQQFSGCNAVIFFSGKIFEDAHTSLDADVSTVIVGVCQVIATYVATLLIDRLGRRPLLMLSGLSLAISGAVLGGYFYVTSRPDYDTTLDIGWLPIVCMVVFIVMFSIGYGPIPWLYMSEVFSAQIKETAMAIATVTNWVSVFIVTKFYSQLSDAIGNYSTFWIFSGISVVGIMFTFFCVVETKGKDFETIIQELGGSSVTPGSNGKGLKSDVEKDKY